MIKDEGNLAIGIIDNGKVYYYGIMRDKDTLKTIENSSSLFQIGSVSKVFTTSVLAHYIENGEINVDETIDRYLGFKLNKDLKLKWIDLANHTSGLASVPDRSYIESLSNAENPYLDYDEVWMNTYLKTKIEIDTSLKGKDNYSNLGMSILGNALSTFKSLSLDSLYNETIFEKYGMKNTFFYEKTDKGRLVIPYDLDGTVATIWELKSFNPAGGIVSNVEDLSKFLLANLDNKNKALIRTHKPTLYTDSLKSTGLGWSILTSRIKHQVLFHNGSTINYTSSVTLDLDSRKGVILLSNINDVLGKNDLDKLNFAILRYLNK